MWRDHYRVHNTKITGSPGMVESFGRVAEVNDLGVALFQNRIINAVEIGAEECLDGQFVLGCDITDVEMIEVRS